MIHQKIKSLKPSATLAINSKVKELRNKGEQIVHFGFGQSPFPIHKSIVNELKKHASNNNYLATLGLLKLREQVSIFLKKHQNLYFLKENILIGPGSKELLFQTILMLDTTFLIPKGSWVSYVPQIKANGGSFNILETFLEDNFKLSAATLETFCLSNNTKQFSLILNSPNNPTGAVYSKKELEELALVCKKYKIIVLSDEIYSQLNFLEQYSTSISEFYPEKTIVFGGLSKVFSAGGYRLGFMALPKDLEFLKTNFKSLFSETFSAVASPIQYAAIKAFKMPKKLQVYIENQSIILKGVFSYIYNEFTALGLQCTNSNGAFYMMIGFANFKSKINNLNINTSEQLSNFILEKHKTALLPASDFYFKESELFFRLAFVDFKGKNILKAYKKEKKISKEFIKEHCINIYQGVENIKDFVKTL